MKTKGILGMALALVLSSVMAVSASAADSPDSSYGYLTGRQKNSNHGLSSRRITSGAGQDAQNMALLCPSAMIFAPSANGISHNPREFTSDEDLISCAKVFMDVMMELAEANNYNSQEISGN